MSEESLWDTYATYRKKIAVPIATQEIFVWLTWAFMAPAALLGGIGCLVVAGVLIPEMNDGTCPVDTVKGLLIAQGVLLLIMPASAVLLLVPRIFDYVVHGGSLLMPLEYLLRALLLGAAMALFTATLITMSTSCLTGLDTPAKIAALVLLCCYSVLQYLPSCVGVFLYFVTALFQLVIHGCAIFGTHATFAGAIAQQILLAIRDSYRN